MTKFGMSKKLGTIAFNMKQNEFSIEKPFSESTATIIDEEVKAVVDSAYAHTLQLLSEKQESLEKVAKLLLEKEVLSRSDLKTLLGPRPNGANDRLTYEELTYADEMEGDQPQSSPSPQPTPSV